MAERNQSHVPATGDVVLLTGASGYIGRRVLDALISRGYRVVATVRRQSDLSGLATLEGKFELYDLDAAPVREVFCAFDVAAVVHLAAQLQREATSLSSILRANLVFGVDLLEAAVAAGVRRFVSTDTQLDPGVNAYALSKRQFRQWLPSFRGRIDIVNARLGNVYGPEPGGFGLVSWLLAQLVANEPRVELTPGEQLRDFVHVTDVAAAFITLLESALPPDLVNDFDVGSGSMVSIRCLAETARECVEAERGPLNTVLDFGALPYRHGEAMKPRFDVAPLRALGWDPQYSLRAGLLQAIRSLPGPEC